ncbi:WXG100 family type VII secretion target [Streptoalloteichus tenebrarius]|uniref:ESAT-6-like protein n=1 Tax=Streptoalloteichus tenebrarius (strain ATCC 17920 / DSM 40477 / JCM 4838 / CBS 697.72 / NBRC 16177 / NCIMB 11028 / NRRL B-12390 / A12253. 1 / ISP 5477) TaxID=1933 RepID=A0ABT1HXH4_STRSD|nr:WXG100 family type VII secretion target [Streptoalloteichus tenebrarius]MCP2260205.1 WXG100 family type VII secretion target [Streptoalloteichus tenebrarius]
MAGSYTTDSETMRQAGVDVLNTNSDIQGSLSSLRGQIEPLAAAWKGDAAAAFHKLIERWQHDADKLNNALSDIADMMGASSQEYLRQEEEQASSMNSILGALGGEV